MKDLGHRPLRMLRALAGLHAGYEDLLAYRDRELGRIGRWCVETHLARCAVCQREVELIEADLRRFKRMDDLLYTSDILDLPMGLRRLHQAVQDWEAKQAWDGKLSSRAKAEGGAGLRQLETEFGIYMGDRATATFLLKMSSGVRKNSDLLVEAESVLSDFFGPCAASAVTQRILYTQTSREKSTQGLPAS